MADPRLSKFWQDHSGEDTWVQHEGVEAIAANHAVLDLLQKPYGRRLFPFQTLNFPVGTEQHLHSVSFTSAAFRSASCAGLVGNGGLLFGRRAADTPARFTILSNMIGRRGYEATANMRSHPSRPRGNKSKIASYYTPAFSDESLGDLDLRVMIDVETEELRPNQCLGGRVKPEHVRRPPSLIRRSKEADEEARGNPDDCDEDAYDQLNPHVA